MEEAALRYHRVGQDVGGVVSLLSCSVSCVFGMYSSCTAGLDERMAGMLSN